MNPTAAAEKKAWRQRLRQAVRGLSPEQRQAASEAVCGRIRGLPEWGRAHAVLVFSPLADEPDIREVARAALADGKRLVCPAYDAARGVIWMAFRSGMVQARLPDGAVALQVDPAVAGPLVRPPASLGVVSRRREGVRMQTSSCRRRLAGGMEKERTAFSVRRRRLSSEP